jgi:hypothetical protein
VRVCASTAFSLLNVAIRGGEQCPTIRASTFLAILLARHFQAFLVAAAFLTYISAKQAMSVALVAATAQAIHCALGVPKRFFIHTRITRLAFALLANKTRHDPLTHTEKLIIVESY